jgi:hypothetical protein
VAALQSPQLAHAYVAPSLTWYAIESHAPFVDVVHSWYVRLPHDTALSHVVTGPPASVPMSIVLPQYDESCCSADVQLVQLEHVKVWPSVVLYAMDAHSPVAPTVVHSWYFTVDVPHGFAAAHVVPLPASLPPSPGPRPAHAWAACVLACPQSWHVLQTNDWPPTVFSLAMQTSFESVLVHTSNVAPLPQAVGTQLTLVASETEHPAPTTARTRPVKTPQSVQVKGCIATGYAPGAGSFPG